MNSKWDIRFLELAEQVSTWSKDPSTQVGAVIVRDKQVDGMGFNGFPAGVPDKPEWLADKEFKNTIVIHAEENAIRFDTGSRLQHLKPTLYTTVHPCPKCTALAISHNVQRIVSLANSKYTFPLSMELMKQAKVKFDLYDLEI